MHQIDYVNQAYSFICWRTQWKFAFDNEKQFEMGGIRDRSNRKRSGKWIKVTEYLKSQNATVWYECKVTCEQIIIFCACVIESQSIVPYFTPVWIMMGKISLLFRASLSIQFFIKKTMAETIHCLWNYGFVLIWFALIMLKLCCRFSYEWFIMQGSPGYSYTCNSGVLF